MNKDQIEGRIDQVAGKAKEAAGKLVGNEKLTTEGVTDQIKGKVKAGYGDVKEQAKDKAKNLINKI